MIIQIKRAASINNNPSCSVLSLTKYFASIASEGLFIQINNLGGVDNPMGKTSLERHLIQAHGVLHIISCIRDDSHTGISTERVIVKPVVVVRLCLQERTLWKVDPIQLVVGSLVNRVTWCSHRLLTHLTLVHITRRLIEFREGCHVRNDTHERVWIQLLVCSFLFQDQIGC